MNDVYKILCNFVKASNSNNKIDMENYRLSIINETVTMLDMEVSKLENKISESNYNERLIDDMNVGTDLDYLQVDCEPSKTTFEILTAIPFEKYRFAVITYEHDHSVDITSSYRDKSRRFLKSYGYELVVKDVAPNDEYTFEDWWVHPDLVNPDIVSQMKSVNTDVTNIVKYFFT
jgi:hypothetical protein